MKNSTVGTTEIKPVETEVTKSEKQESHDFSRGRFNDPHYECELEWHITGWEKRLNDISKVPDDCPIKKYGLEHVYKDSE